MAGLVGRVYNEVFRLLAKKALHTGVRTGCHYLISLSVCNIRRFC